MILMIMYKIKILLMEPLPSVNKAYTMVLRVEKQRSVQVQFSDSYDSAAMSTRTTTIGRGHAGYHTGAMNSGRERRSFGRSQEEKAKLVYDHCKGIGHNISGYFKLHSYPDWYKRLKDQRSRLVANMTEVMPI